MHRLSVHSRPARLAAPLAAALALTACSLEAPDGREPGPSQGAASLGTTTSLASGLLAEFDDCDALLSYYQETALPMVTPYGLGSGGGSWVAEEDAAAADGGMSMPSAAATDSGGGGESASHSTTNVQEEGVDEPDLIKTDGSIIVAVSNGKVRIVDVATEELVSTVSLPGRRDQVSPAEVLLHGKTLVVLSQEWGNLQPVGDRYPAFQPSRTVVTTVDLTDPTAPRTVGSVRLEGSYTSARLVDGTMRLVMLSEPTGLMTTQPRNAGLGAEDEAEEANRELVRASTIEDWVPHIQELDADGAVVSTEQLLGCDQISRPRDPAGLTTLSVLTFDVGSATPTSGAGLVASGATVYASTDRLIVGTSPWDLWRWMPIDTDVWRGPQPANRTDLHAFDISDPDATSYVASGSVEGRIINQWALDEEAGVIRVATTTDPPNVSADSHSSLVVLTEEGEDLVETGRVDGMGITEQIQSVRYLSPDLAAIVTFRQTDPLYLVDTSDPTAPKVTGELKIPGYSAYLHPVGDGWLLGVGQDADEKTGSTQGAQVSLFDIRDLSDPKRTEAFTWKNSYTPVESDHRAFLSWSPTGQVFLPISQWSESSDSEEHFAGVQTLTLGEGTLAEGPRVRTGPPKQDWGDAPLRTLVIGEDLWTLDWQGLGRYDLETLEGGWAVDLP